MRKFNFTNFLAYTVVVFCLFYFFYVSSRRFPLEMTKDIADIKMAMVAIISSVISYYFGASKKDKSEQNPTTHV